MLTTIAIIYLIVVGIYGLLLSFRWSFVECVCVWDMLICVQSECGVIEHVGVASAQSSSILVDVVCLGGV